MSLRLLSIALIASIGAIDDAEAQQVSSPSRNELLYSTHCVSCHENQNNWKNKKNATNWISLQAEVHRWQTKSAGNGNDDEQATVSNYLNNFVFYCNNARSNESSN